MLRSLYESISYGNCLTHVNKESIETDLIIAYMLKKQWHRCNSLLPIRLKVLNIFIIQPLITIHELFGFIIELEGGIFLIMEWYWDCGRNFLEVLIKWDLEHDRHLFCQVVVVYFLWLKGCLSFVLWFLLDLASFEFFELVADFALDVAHDIILSDNCLMAILHHEVHDLLDKIMFG